MRWKCPCEVYAIDLDDTLLGFFEVLGFWFQTRILDWHRCARS